MHLQYFKALMISCPPRLYIIKYIKQAKIKPSTRERKVDAKLSRLLQLIPELHKELEQNLVE